MFARRRLIAYCCFPALISCTDRTDATGPSLRPVSAIITSTHIDRRTLDDKFWLIAGEVPEFGGVYVAGDGTPEVVLTDTAKLGVAVEAVRRILATPRDSTFLRPMRAVQGVYGFRQLFEWFIQARSVLSQSGVISIDVHERQNRLRIGVANLSHSGTVLAHIISMGVPTAAVLIEVDEPASFSSTLSDYVRPIPNGLKVATTQEECTLGVNASTAGSPRTQYFITNSHCTNVLGVVDGAVFYQPDAVSFGNRIGYEVRDVTFFTGGACPSGRFCQYADAALIQYDQDNYADFGYIAETAYRSPPLSGPGSVEIVDVIAITGVEGYSVGPAPDGSEINKIGPSSGWTYGTVTGTCVDVNVLDTSITILCQTRVGATAADGDSGATAFRYDAWVQGIQSLKSSAGTTLYYSPMTAIIRELNLTSLSLSYCFC